MIVKAPDIWKNPYARCGIVNVNVLIGEGVEERDRELFFGPLDGGELFIAGETHWSPAKLVTHLGLTASVKDAARQGFESRVPLPDGFSQLRVHGKHLISVLNVLGLEWK